MRTSLANGINLAYWLYRIHPNLFAALRVPARQAHTLGHLGDDFSPAPSDFVPFDTSSMDLSIDPSSGVLAPPSVDVVSAAIDPVLVTLPDPQLSSVGIDSALTLPTVSFDTGATAAPSSSGLGSALSSIGSFLSSATGLNALTNLTTAVYKANTPQAATIGTQIGRTQAGLNAAPITYAYNSAGALVPVLAKPNTAGIALTPQTLAGLVPARFIPYVVPTVIGLMLLWAFSGSRK